MDFTFVKTLFDYDTILIASISFGTGAFILLSWFVFGKKIEQDQQQDTNIDPIIKSQKCICLSDNCKCKASTLTYYKSIPKRIKIFLLKPVRLRFPKLRIPLFGIILHSVIVRAKMAFKKKIATEQNKAEASLHKLARSLWDQGKYAEAERINLEILNVRRLIFGDKK